MNLIVTGTISIDTVHTATGEERENILGGSCTYFAAAASHYGPVRLVAAVINPTAYVHERAVCVDTTAAGGNASLLAAAE